jgi:hypothetical protein
MGSFSLACKCLHTIVLTAINVIGTVDVAFRGRGSQKAMFPAAVALVMRAHRMFMVPYTVDCTRSVPMVLPVAVLAACSCFHCQMRCVQRLVLCCMVHVKTGIDVGCQPRQFVCLLPSLLMPMRFGSLVPALSQRLSGCVVTSNANMHFN